MSKVATQTTNPQERAFLVGLNIKNQPGLLTIDDSLQELALLAETAGLGVVGQAQQTLEHPNSKTYMGSGKIREIKALVEDLVADVVLFDDELNPRHQRELEKEFGESVQVVDRTALILDIFAQHAQTREGALQVELAQYEYQLPRLTRAWTHLARQAGGRGPGETQLEVDRRQIRRRIASLKKELEKVRAHRSRHRERRKRSAIPTVALVGYTNAGKSTLLNFLSDAEVYVANELFATLDPTTRRVISSKGHSFLFTDTVGFIQKLPTGLIAAFRATLEEIHEADLLLHVVDISHANAASQAKAVQATLEELQVSGIPMVTALNKIDRVPDQEYIFDQVDSFERAVPISARTGDGVDTLLAVIERVMFEDSLEVTVELPYKEGHLISIFHDHGEVASISYDRERIVINGKLPQRLEREFRPYLMPDNSELSGQDPHEVFD